MAELSNLVRKAAHEISPAYDMERISFKEFKPDPNKSVSEQFSEMAKTGIHNFVQYVWFAKPVIRGAVAGSIAGSIGGLISGQDVGDTARIGAAYGAMFDESVFAIRFLTKYIKDHYGLGQRRE